MLNKEEKYSYVTHQANLPLELWKIKKACSTF